MRALSGLRDLRLGRRKLVWNPLSDMQRWIAKRGVVLRGAARTMQPSISRESESA